MGEDEIGSLTLSLRPSGVQLTEWDAENDVDNFKLLDQHCTVPDNVDLGWMVKTDEVGLKNADAECEVA